MSYTMYTPLNVWLDPASVTDVVAYIQTYLSENTIYSETEIETIIHDYLIAHPELIGGVQSVNGKTGTVVLSASDINTENNVTIESVLASLSSQISSIAASVATNTANITNLTGRVSTAETDLTNLKSNLNIAFDTGIMPINKTLNWQSGYVGTNGKINTSKSSVFALVPMLAGEKVTVGTANSGVAIISKTDADSVSVGDTVTVIEITSSGNYETHTYTAEEDLNIVLCVTYSNYQCDFSKNSAVIDQIKNDIYTVLPISKAIDKMLYNIMDLSAMNIGYRMNNNNGELVADESYVASDFMACEGLQNIMLIARASGSNKTTDFTNPSPGGLYWNFYDADKVFIRSGNAGTNPASVPNNAAFARIRFSKQDYDRSLSTYNLWGVFGVSSLSDLINWTFYQAPQNVLTDTIYEVDGSKVHPHIISCWGDSLTDGTGDNNSYGWPNRLANLIGYNKVNVNNFGLGGQTSLQIARRFSAMPVYVNPFTIPADTSAVSVTLFDDDGDITSLFNRGSGIAAADLYRACVNPCIISGVEGTLTQTDSNGGYTFARKTSGEAITVSRPALLETWGYRNQRNDVTIIWAGTNDTSNWQSISWTMENIIRMIETLNTDKYIIIGLTAKTLFSDIVSRNNAMFRKFGRHFLDVRKYLLNYGLTDVGITPTEQDTTDISDGEIPSSLRSDSIHLNNYGYQGVANCVYRLGKELGYWD